MVAERRVRNCDDGTGDHIAGLAAGTAPPLDWQCRTLAAVSGG
ncbi:hypothetical protein [Sandarakinorhabdus sp.]